MADYLVSIDYATRTKLHSDTFIVGADSPERAKGIALDQLKEDNPDFVEAYDRRAVMMLSPEGASWLGVREVVRGWAEQAREGLLPERAHAIMISGFYIATPSGENVELARIQRLDDLRLLLISNDGEEIPQDLMSDSDWIALAAHVQESHGQ